MFEEEIRQVDFFPASFSDLLCFPKQKRKSTPPEFNDKYFHPRPSIYGTFTGWGGHSSPSGPD